MTFALGTATGKIALEYDGTGVADAEKSVEGLKKKTGDVNSSINTLGNTAAVGGIAIAAGFAVAINSAANFEQRMSAVGAVSGATGSEFDALREKALQLGQDTSFSAGEAAQAIEELVKAGISVPDVLNGAADATVALAAAGEIALPEAATIASNAMNQFGLKAEEMTNVADMFAGAANTSAIGVTDIGQALQQVGAVANLAGVSLEDVTTAIGLMGNAGIAGSDAGTSLKSMFMRLNPSTKKATEEMQRLGLITKDGSNRFYDAQGNMKSLSDVSQVLQGSLKGMSAQQKQAALQVLFGSDAIRGAAILAKNGAKGFDEFAGSMGKVSAADVAAKRLDNLKGDLEAMKGSLETAGIAVGSLLLPPLRKLVDFITSLTNSFSSLSSTQQAWIIGVIGAVGALLLIVAGIAKMIVFINTTRMALVALRGTMIATWAATLGPILLVVAIIALVIAAIVLLWKHSETFRNIVLGVWNAVKAAAAAVAAWFMGTFVPAMKAVWDAIVAAVKFVFDLIVMIITTYVAIWTAIITTALNAIKAVWTAVWGLFGPLIKAVFDLIVAIIKLAWTIIKGVFLLTLMAIKAAVSSVFNGIKSVVTSVMNAIRAVTSAVWGFIGPFVMGIVNGIKSAVTGAWNAIKTATTTVWNALKGVVSTAINAVMDVVDDVMGKITGVFSSAGTWLLDAGKAIIQGLIDGIMAMISKVTDAVGAVTDAVGKFLPGSPVQEGALKVLNRGHAGKQIVSMIVDGMVSNSAMMESGAARVAQMIPTGMNTVSTSASGGPSAPAVAFPAGMGITGTLSIDETGRAYITALAEDSYDRFSGEQQRWERMHYR